MNSSPTPAHFSIQMFGRFTVEINGEEIKPHRPPDFRLLAYLLLRHDQEVERNEATVCWRKASDAEFWESDVRSSLARGVFTLTKTLSSEGKRLRKPHAQLLVFNTTGADLDLLIWEDALAEGSVEALERIASLARQPFLEGWDDPWVQQVRERFHNDYVRALRSAARRATEHCHWNAALRAFALLFERDPTDDATMRDHLRLLADRRRFRQMQRLYDAYVKHGKAVFNPFDSKTAQFYRELHSAADQGKQNLQRAWVPTPLPRFIPRPADVQHLHRWIRSERLVTLTGTGGVGKTRLAIATAEEVGEDFYDGVWFVDLSELQNPEEIPTHLAHALSLEENVGRTTTEEIVMFLRARETLLVLDNCEHVLEASARLVASILENCPEVRILTTSREPLGILGEFVWRVPFLKFPEVGVRVGTQTLAKFSAIRLLIERASHPQFPITINAINAEAATQICRRLDGIPLAIELAAVQVRRRRRSLQEVADSLDASLSFVTEGSRTAPFRQQTLRATIEWSYRLLSDAEKRVFERLGVFVGGFTEQAACAVCTDDLLTGEEVLRVVLALVEKSLVELIPSEYEPRYHLLQTIRQYALEQLALRQEETPSSTLPGEEDVGALLRTHRRHLLYFAGFAERTAAVASASEPIV